MDLIWNFQGWILPVRYLMNENFDQDWHGLKFGQDQLIKRAFYDGINHEYSNIIVVQYLLDSNELQSQKTQRQVSNLLLSVGHPEGGI